MVFLVAEIGVNWDGDLQLAQEMMSRAKSFGFDAVKFQAFDNEIIKEHSERVRLVKSSITKENIDEINNIAKSIGIEWFCTPMYLEAVDLIEPYVKRIKIRVFDGMSLIENRPSKLVERILKTNKDIIVSSQTNPKNCNQFANSKISWLYCISKYPCTLEDLDFTEFSYFDGFSNHCPKIIAPVAATILGAKIIEIHVTSDKSKKFVDNPVSFDYDEQKKIANLIRDAEKIRK